MTTQRLILALASARHADLALVSNTSDDIAVTDEVWEAALAATAAGVAAGEEPEAIRHRLLAAWRHDVAGAPDNESVYVTHAWTRVLLAFDAAVVGS